MQAETAQQSFRAAYLPTLTLTSELQERAVLLDAMQHRMVVIEAGVHSLGPGPARIESATWNPAPHILELPLEPTGGDIIPVGTTDKLTILLNESHPAVEVLREGTGSLGTSRSATAT